MAELRLPAPAPVELVPADEAMTAIDDTHRDLAELERRVADARATAEEVEARAAREGADERASTWAIVRLQRFLDELRDEAERDARTVVEAARRGARARAETTRADDARERHARAVEGGPSPAPPLVAVEAIAPELIASEPVPPVSVARVEPLRTPAPAPAPMAREPGLSWTPAFPSAPTANGNHVAPAPAPSPAPPSASVAEPPAAVAAPAPPLPVALAPPSAPVTVTPTVARVVAPAPTQTAPATRKHSMRGFPLSAVLEVVAVLLILAFILLRLS